MKLEKMFSYAYERHPALVRLGQYVSHAIVKPSTKDNTGFFYNSIYDRIRSVEELNALDRHELANEFLQTDQGKRFKRQIGPAAEEEHKLYIAVIHDIAYFLDVTIPEAYLKWHRFFPHVPQVRTIEESCLIYHFPQSEDLAKQFKAIKDELFSPDRSATDKQKSYLSNLMDNAGYVLKCHLNDLTISQASQLISFFTDDIELPDDLAQLLEYDI